MELVLPCDIRKKQELVSKNLFFGCLFFCLIYYSNSPIWEEIWLPVRLIFTAAVLYFNFFPYIFLWLWAYKKSVRPRRFWFSNWISLAGFAYLIIMYLQFGYFVLADKAIARLYDEKPTPTLYSPFIYGPFVPLLNTLKQALEFDAKVMPQLTDHLLRIGKTSETFHATICNRRSVANARGELKALQTLIEEWEETMFDYVHQIKTCASINFLDKEMRTYYSATLLTTIENDFLAEKHFISLQKQKYQTLDKIYQHFSVIHGDFFVDGRSITFINDSDEAHFSNLLTELEAQNQALEGCF